MNNKNSGASTGVFSKDMPLFRILIAIGIGIALAVALDNIAIGIGVGFVFLLGALGLGDKKKLNDSQTGEK